MFWIALCGALPPASAAEEWTRFRGPNGSGLSAAAAIPVRWAEQDYNWKVRLPGGGHSSPVLWGDRVFLISAERETLKRFVLCIRARDGAILWQQTFDLGPYSEHEKNAMASSTPAVDQDHVYFCHYTLNHLSLIALTHEGRPLWECDLGAYKSLNGGASSPIVYKDLVILANDQEGDESSCFLIALDRWTGKTRWKLPRKRGDTAYATPCVYESANQAAQLIFCGQAHGMTSVDPSTGGLNWELNGLFDKMVVASPVIASGLVIGTCGAVGGGNFLAAVRLTSKDGHTVPEVAYKVRLSASYVPTPIVKGDLIFMWNDNGIVTCLRAATGKEMWRERLEGRGQYFGSPVCVNDRLYCISVEGDVVVLAASPKFQLLARNPLGEKSYATPAVADGRMYLRTYSHLISIGGGR